MDGETAYRIFRQTVENQACPVKGTEMEFIDYQQGKKFALRLSQENLSQFSDSQIESVVTWAVERCELATTLSGIKTVVEKVRSFEEEN